MKGVHIVSEEWLIESKREKEFLDPSEYRLKMLKGARIGMLGCSEEEYL